MSLCGTTLQSVALLFLWPFGALAMWRFALPYYEPVFTSLLMVLGEHRPFNRPNSDSRCTRSIVTGTIRPTSSPALAPLGTSKNTI